MTRQVDCGSGRGSPMGREHNNCGREPLRFDLVDEEQNPFGFLGGDPEELRRRLEEFSQQMQGAQRVAWADNAIKLAVDMTVACINRLELTGSSDEQAAQVRDAIRLVFPEAVILVREAREGLA